MDIIAPSNISASDMIDDAYNTGERQDGTAAELLFYRCGNAPAV